MGPQTGRGHSPKVSQLPRFALAACVAGSALWLMAGTAFNSGWPSGERVVSTNSTAVAHRTRSALERHGVRVDGRVATALDAVVGEWTRRADLQTQFRAADGLPDLQGLLSWVSAMSDSSAFELIPFRGALDELGYRMAILPPNGDVVPVLAWTLRNRTEPRGTATDALIRVADVWRSRSDVREHFTIDGRVRVGALLFWAATVGPADPAFDTFLPVAHQLSELSHEYRGPNI